MPQNAKRCAWRRLFGSLVEVANAASTPVKFTPVPWERKRESVGIVERYFRTKKFVARFAHIVTGANTSERKTYLHWAGV